jgi:hypothetical protein
VWRFVELIRQKRPELRLTLFDTSPGGLLVISKVNPKNRSLWGDYNKMLRRLADDAEAAVPEHVLARKDAVPPTVEQIRTAAGR